jgi:hypothetical protein
VALLPLSCSCRESRLLVPWCAGGRCGMVDSNEDCGRSRRPGVEDRGWSCIGRIICGQTIERSGDTVYSLYRARGHKERGFLG